MTTKWQFVWVSNTQARGRLVAIGHWKHLVRCIGCDKNRHLEGLYCSIILYWAALLVWQVSTAMDAKERFLTLHINIKTINKQGWYVSSKWRSWHSTVIWAPLQHPTTRGLAQHELQFPYIVVPHYPVWPVFSVHDGKILLTLLCGNIIHARGLSQNVGRAWLQWPREDSRP